MLAIFSILILSAHALEIDPLRVLVFPHIGKYTNPQNREKVIDHVKIRSAGECRLLSEGKKPVILKSATELAFDYESLKEPRRVECTSPATIVREAGLKNFSYPGIFRVVRASNPTRVQIINIVGLEEYLRGVVPSEVVASWPEETLKAQAVAARTYAAYETLQARAHNPHAIYDLDDTVQFQAYLGMYGRTASTDAATQATQGELMLYRDQPIKAYFTGDSGGYTEDPKNVWGSPLPYLKCKPEVYDPALVKSAWTLALSRAELENRLREAGLLPTNWVGPIREVRILDRVTSGRATRLLIGSSSSHVELNANDFRFAVKLRSTLFEIAGSDEGISFRGRGWGHGVGMSQEGARALAEQFHWDYRKILEFYFEGVSFKVL